MGLYRKIVNRIKIYVIWGEKGHGSKVIKPKRILGKSNIYIGKNVNILNDARIEACVTEKSRLYIGDNTSIEQGCHIIAADKMIIGKDCVISSYVYIGDCSHDYRAQNIIGGELVVKKTTVGDHVFIGTGAKIMPGVTINNNAIIGANAVVTKDIPQGEIWGGVPAKKIR